MVNLRAVSTRSNNNAIKIGLVARVNGARCNWYLVKTPSARTDSVLSRLCKRIFLALIQEILVLAAARLMYMPGAKILEKAILYDYGYSARCARIAVRFGRSEDWQLAGEPSEYGHVVRRCSGYNRDCDPARLAAHSPAERAQAVQQGVWGGRMFGLQWNANTTPGAREVVGRA